MTGGEAIDLLGSLRGGLHEARRAKLLERFELDPTKRGRQYSKGNRQKVAIVAALASDVELLILDETLADRLSIIRDGRVVQSGTLADLRGQTRTTINATLARTPEDHELAVLGDVHLDSGRLTATVDSARVGEAMAALVPVGLTSLTVAPPSLESLFLSLYGEQSAQADR